MNRILPNLLAALSSLREQRSRAYLSSLGVMVGSLAILLLVSIAKGVQADMTREVEGIGINLLIVLPGRVDEGSMMAPGLLGISYLEEQDIDRIRQLPGVRRAIPVSFVGSGLTAGEVRSPTTLVVATKPDWFAIRNTKFQAGEGLTESDAGKRVCVLGSVAAKKLFPEGNALGQYLQYNGQAYRIVGVTANLEGDNSVFSQGSFENMAFLPYELIRNAQENAQIDRIFIQTEPDREPKTLVASVERVLSERLDRETYSVLTQQDLLRLVFKVMSILTTLLTGLTSIALFVGGVGIMTVMLMSVQERSKEIGIRKTVGARRSDIFFQFLCEAVILSLGGGLAGLAFSALVAALIARFTVIKPAMTMDIVMLAIGVCLAVGTIFGLIPAIRAARRDPVQSLRWE